MGAPASLDTVLESGLAYDRDGDRRPRPCWPTPWTPWPGRWRVTRSDPSRSPPACHAPRPRPNRNRPGIGPDRARRPVAQYLLLAAAAAALFALSMFVTVLVLS